MNRHGAAPLKRTALVLLALACAVHVVTGVSGACRRAARVRGTARARAALTRRRLCGARPPARGRCPATTLLAKVKEGDLEKVRFHLAATSSDVDEVDGSGRTALHWLADQRAPRAATATADGTDDGPCSRHRRAAVGNRGKG